MNLFVEGYKDIILKDIDDYGKIGTREYPLPSVPRPSIIQLLHLINERVESQRLLLNLTGSFIVVGPINGGIHKLIQMLHICGMPPETKYVFLGNYIGDEEYSLEVITLLISMAATFPESVFLLKGANEIKDSLAMMHFCELVEGTFDHLMFELFSEFFDNLPLAATVSNVTLVCHGGFGPHTGELMYIENCKTSNSDYPTIEREVILAEPSDEIDEFDGNKFSIKELTKFTKRNLVFRIIRAQQEKKIPGRVYSFASGKVLSLFHDLSGVIKIGVDGSISTIRFEPIVPLKRSEVFFITINSIATALSSVIDKSKKNTNLKIRVRLPHANSSVEKSSKMRSLNMMIPINPNLYKTPY